MIAFRLFRMIHGGEEVEREPFDEIRLPCAPSIGESIVVEHDKCWEVRARKFSVERGTGRCDLLVVLIAQATPPPPPAGRVLRPVPGPRGSPPGL